MPRAEDSTSVSTILVAKTFQNEGWESNLWLSSVHLVPRTRQMVQYTSTPNLTHKPACGKAYPLLLPALCFLRLSLWVRSLLLYLPPPRISSLLLSWGLLLCKPELTHEDKKNFWENISFLRVQESFWEMFSDISKTEHTIQQNNKYFVHFRTVKVIYSAENCRNVPLRSIFFNWLKKNPQWHLRR